MSFFKKVVKDASKTTENLVGNMASSNAQNATNAAVDGMDLFRWKIGTPIIQNGHFDQQKGNLFEYIEALQVRECQQKLLLQMFMIRARRQTY